MKKLVRKLFPPNDWMPIKVLYANWTITTDFGSYEDKAFYEIQYSKFRNSFRLKCRGYRPKKHQYYTHVVDVYYRIVYNHTEANTEVQAANKIFSPLLQNINNS